MNDTTKTPRIACFRVPLFPLAARLRCEPELSDLPVAIVDEAGDTARIVAVSHRARQAGVRARQTVASAQATLPGLIVRSRDCECESAAHEALLDVAEGLVPVVEEGGDNFVFLDISSLGSSGEAEIESRLGRAWIQTVAKQAGLPVRIGFAGSQPVARLAAEHSQSPKSIAPEDEARLLADLPWSFADPKPEIAKKLRRWGLRTFGEIAAQSADLVTEHLGPAGDDLWAIARGESSATLTGRRPPAVFREGMSLAKTTLGLEALLEVAHGAMERLTERLKAQNMGCVCLEVSLRLEPEKPYRRSVALPAATNRLETLMTLLRLELESHPPRAAINSFFLTAHPERPRGGQISLFGPPAVLPENFAGALESLFETVGEDRVGSPHTADGCRPERFTMAPFAPPPSEQDDHVPRPGLMTVRVLRPPVAIEVLTDDFLAGSASIPPPDFVKSLVSAEEPRPQIQGRVRVASGPWTLADGWWTESPTTRDYWDVELSGRGAYRIFRDRDSGEWFADGIYD